MVFGWVMVVCKMSKMTEFNGCKHLDVLLMGREYLNEKFFFKV